MKKVNSTMKNVAIQNLKDSGDVSIYNIPLTELNQLTRTLDLIKRDVKEQTKTPKNVMIVMSVR